MTNESWVPVQDALSDAESHLTAGSFAEARKSAFLAGKAALEGYLQGQNKEAPPATEPGLAGLAKAAELPFEIFAVCDKLDLENPDLPKRLKPLRTPREEAEE